MHSKPIDMERLFSDYGDNLLRLCYLYLKDRHLAEDAVQDIFIKVYEQYKSFKGLSSEKTWITRIAINVCKNYMRTAWIRKVHLFREPEEYISESAYQPSSQIDFLTEALMQLKPIYREVVLLHYYQHLKISEIATILNAKESTITVRLTRAREKLKKIIERNSSHGKTENIIRTD